MKKSLLIMACASMVAISGIGCATATPKPPQSAQRIQQLLNERQFGAARQIVKAEVASYGKNVTGEIKAWAKEQNAKIDESEIKALKASLDAYVNSVFPVTDERVEIYGVPGLCKESDVQCNFLPTIKPATNVKSCADIAKKFDDVRDAIWNKIPSSDSQKVIDELYKYRCTLVAERVNPVHFVQLLRYMPYGMKTYLEKNDFEGARAYLDSFAAYDVYGDLLDSDLNNVQNALVEIPTNPADSIEIFNEARRLMREIFGSEDFQNGGSDSEQGSGYEPDDSVYKEKLAIFKDHLKAYGCSDADQGKILNAFEKDAQEIIERLRKEGPWSEKTYLPVKISTRKLNDLQDNLKKFMLEEVINAAEDAYLKAQAEASLNSVVEVSNADAEDMLKTFESLDEKSLALVTGNDENVANPYLYVADTKVEVVENEGETVIENKGEEATANQSRVIKVKQVSAYMRFMFALRKAIEDDMTAQTQKLVKAGKYEAAREYLWTAYLQIPEVIKYAINVHRVTLMNVYVNPANYSTILDNMRGTVNGLVASGKYDEARAFLAGIKPVPGYTKDLKVSLDNVKETLVKLDINEENAQKLVDDANIMLYDYLASKVYEDKFLAAGDVFKPNDAAFQTAVSEFLGKASLYGCDDEQCKALNEAILNDAMPLIRALYIPFADGNSEIPAVLGVGAMNSLVEAQKTVLLNTVIDPAHANARIKEFKSAILPLAESGKYDEAREAIFNFGVLGNANVDKSVYAVKCGFMNTMVNPQQMTAVYADLETKVSAALETKDYQAAIDAVDALSYVPYYLPAVNENLDQAAVAAKDNHNVDAKAAEKIMEEAKDKITSWFIPRDGKDDDGYAAAHVENWEDVEKKLSEAGAKLINMDCDKDSVIALNDSIIAAMKSNIDTTGLYDYLNTKQYNDEIDALKKQYKAIIAGAIAREGAACSVFVPEAELSSYIKAMLEASRNTNDIGLANTLVDAVRLLRRNQRGVIVTPNEASALLVAGTYMDIEDIMNLAISLGVDIDAPAPRDINGRSAYLMAMQYGFSGRVDKLLAKASRSSVDANGYNAIHYAIANGNIEAVKSLLLEGVDPNQVGKDGRTALIYAVDMESITNVRNLLSYSKLEAKDAAGRTALLAAVSAGRLDIVKVLVDAKADLKVKNAAGKNALDIAFEFRNLDMINFLLAQNLMPSENLVNCLVASGDVTMLQLIIDKIQLTDEHLALAIDNCQLPMIVYLVELGYDINSGVVSASVLGLNAKYAEANGKLASLTDAKARMANGNLAAIKGAYVALEGINSVERQQVLLTAIQAMSKVDSIAEYMTAINAVKSVLANAHSNAECAEALANAKVVLASIGKSEIMMPNMDMVNAILGVSEAGDKYVVEHEAAQKVCAVLKEGSNGPCHCKQTLDAAASILSDNNSSTAECLKALDAVQAVLKKASDDMNASIETIRVVTAFTATEWLDQAIPVQNAKVGNMEAIKSYLSSEGVR